MTNTNPVFIKLHEAKSKRVHRVNPSYIQLYSNHIVHVDGNHRLYVKETAEEIDSMLAQRQETTDNNI